MRPVLFELGQLEVYSFGLMVMVGATAGLLIANIELRRRGFPAAVSMPLLGAVTLTMLVGARFVFAVLDSVGTTPTIPVPRGLSAVGAVAGGAVGAWAYARLRGLPALPVFDALCPAAALGEALVRVGCHLAGDGHWGPPTTLPWGMAYRNALAGWDPASGPVHPTPLYESAALLAVFFILWRSRRSSRPPGWQTSLYLVLAGSSRLLLGAFRLDRQELWGLSMGQLAGAIAAFTGASLLLGLFLWQTRFRSVVGRPTVDN